MRRRTTLDIHDYENPEQAFISDSEVTPVASDVSSFTDVSTFTERIKTMKLETLMEKKTALLKLINDFQKELPSDSIEKEWHGMVFNLLETTNAKVMAITKLIDELTEN